ncbi:MAG: hypothetical protein IJC93_10410, partial [Clostridia bacterium]|nr:hypothetical protein [Clostridia bacterium]
CSLLLFCFGLSVRSDSQNLNSSGAVFCFIHCLIYKVHSLVCAFVARRSGGQLFKYTTIGTLCQEVFLKFFQVFLEAFRSLDRLSFSQQPNYYIILKLVCQEVF